jgi:hypothetical protein
MMINYKPRVVIYDHKERYILKRTLRSGYNRKTFIAQVQTLELI